MAARISGDDYPRADIYARHRFPGPDMSPLHHAVRQTVCNIYPQPDGQVRCITTKDSQTVDERTLHVDERRVVDGTASNEGKFSIFDNKNIYTEQSFLLLDFVANFDRVVRLLQEIKYEAGIREDCQEIDVYGITTVSSGTFRVSSSFVVVAVSSLMPTYFDMAACARFLRHGDDRVFHHENEHVDYKQRYKEGGVLIHGGDRKLSSGKLMHSIRLASHPHGPDELCVPVLGYLQTPLYRWENSRPLVCVVDPLARTVYVCAIPLAQTDIRGSVNCCNVYAKRLPDGDYLFDVAQQPITGMASAPLTSAMREAFLHSMRTRVWPSEDEPPSFEQAASVAVRDEPVFSAAIIVAGLDEQISTLPNVADPIYVGAGLYDVPMESEVGIE
jgi:hypothetical protein